MLRYAICSLSVCLLTAACSMTPAKYRYLAPSQALLLPCPPPQLRPSDSIRDFVDNSNERQHAWEVCNALHTALLKWHEEMQRSGATATSGGKNPKPSSP